MASSHQNQATIICRFIHIGGFGEDRKNQKVGQSIKPRQPKQAFHALEFFIKILWCGREDS
ncbi:MAG TPA: hypothetical protein DHV49_01280, partial [Alphaproteobacteria bacterium]|nr:hypothetical protein [Alphaproteobacteria bacterium]